MSKKIDPLITELGDYGLTRQKLRQLGRAPVEIEVRMRNPLYVYPSRARFRELLEKSPEERRALVHGWRVRQHKRLCAEVSPRDVEVFYYNGDPVGLRATVDAKEVARVARLSCVESMRILRIPGLRRKRVGVWREPRWFSVKALFAIQYEGQTRGLQTYEDRIVLVQARSEREARKKAMREFRQYEAPSLTVTGHFFRSCLEKILDVYDLSSDTIDPAGTEVYSEFKDRRMKPEYEWHPVSDCS
jgi:hypothetical protein